jgi:hypothetical protein
MINDQLIATLEKSLRETRNAQHRLMARLREVELEAQRLREEIQALENSAAQTESAIDSLLVNLRSGNSIFGSAITGDELGDRPAAGNSSIDRDHYRSGGSFDSRVPSNVSVFSRKRSVPTRGNNIEPVSNRFADRTITQACALLLREAGRPLHVNELYNLLVAGGMEFKGNNPTISVAVSLNRNRKFRKVGPGTFDLIMREATRAAS